MMIARFLVFLFRPVVIELERQRRQRISERLDATVQAMREDRMAREKAEVVTEFEVLREAEGDPMIEMLRRSNIPEAHHQ